MNRDHRDSALRAGPVMTGDGKPGGEPVWRAGYTLTVLRREPDGKWRLARDANLLSTA